MVRKYCWGSKWHILHYQLGTILANVAHLVTVAALKFAEILGLGAVAGYVALLATVAASTRRGGRAVTGHVTNCVLVSPIPSQQ